MRVKFLSNLHNVSFHLSRAMRDSRLVDASLAYVPFPADDPQTYGFARQAWARRVERHIIRGGVAVMADKWHKADHLVVSDKTGFRMYRRMRSHWLFGRRLRHVAYSPFIHGMEMRDEPFRDSVWGRAWKAYLRGAHRVFHCQPDLERYAGLLGLERTRYVPTPVDIDFWQPTPEPSSGFRVIHPSGHAWSLKGNDALIRAFARIARERKDAVLHLVSSGADFGRSIMLAASLGISDRLVISEYMCQKELRKAMAASHVVADSFTLGVLGMLGIQGMLSGRPVLCYVNEKDYLSVQGSVPPVLNAQTEDDIYGCLRDAAEGATPSGALDYARAAHDPAVGAAIMARDLEKG